MASFEFRLLPGDLSPLGDESILPGDPALLDSPPKMPVLEVFLTRAGRAAAAAGSAAGIKAVAFRCLPPLGLAPPGIAAAGGATWAGGVAAEVEPRLDAGTGTEAEAEAEAEAEGEVGAGFLSSSFSAARLRSAPAT